jgi:hypothetical protein
MWVNPLHLPAKRQNAGQIERSFGDEVIAL